MDFGAGAGISAQVADALVIVPDLVVRPLPGGGSGAQTVAHSNRDRLDETVGLAAAIDLHVASATVERITTVRPSTLFGRGKVADIAERVAAHDAGLVIVDHALTPIQQRNLEREWNTKVLDRTGLILEIFGRRARTREGRLQVELAHLTFQKSRLVRSWTHLERQRGGFGFLGGPGETQIESDRRQLQERIEKIEQDLSKVTRTRALHRSSRERTPFPTVAIVGYTNAGKSTLFNALTGAGVLSQDQVFATLDPTMREVKLESGRRVILSDTVGFISNLPTMLVAAFRATLEEVVAADLILHVRDISHPETEAQRSDVVLVLGDLLGGKPGSGRVGPAVIEVWNKIDCVRDADQQAWVETEAQRLRISGDAPVITSAVTGQGLDDLRAVIDGKIGAQDVTLSVRLPVDAGALRHWIYENGHILRAQSHTNGETTLQFRISLIKHGQLLNRLEGIGLIAQHVTERELQNSARAD